MKHKPFFSVLFISIFGALLLVIIVAVNYTQTGIAPRAQVVTAPPVPVLPGGGSTTNACTVVSFTLGPACPTGAVNATYTCSDGSSGVVGDSDDTCKDPIVLKQEAYNICASCGTTVPTAVPTPVLPTTAIPIPTALPPVGTSPIPPILLTDVPPITGGVNTCQINRTGDCNHDGRTDFTYDFECFRRQYRAEAQCNSADFNCDGKCSLADFEIERQNAQ